MNYILNKKLILKNAFFILIFLATAFVYSFKTNSQKCLIEDFQPRSNGPAAMGLGDRTGSPISSGATCAGCHGGASLNTALSITVIDANGNIVNSYSPGNSYTLGFEVTSAATSGYGFQGVALTNNNWQAGMMGIPTSLNTQVTNLISTGGGLQYAEHLGVSGSGVFSLPWTAPNSGFGDITFYGVGLAINGDGNTTGDNASSSVSLVLSENVATTIGYNQAIYCQNETDPSPTINGTSGGAFSSSAGLSIDANSGTIDLSTSTPGPYVVTYTYSAGTAIFTIIIEPIDNADFSYTNSSFCSNLGLTTPIITGLLGGTFTSNSSSLIIDPISGVIDLINSPGGQYSISYTTSGFCPDSSTETISIIQIDNSTSANGNVLTANLSGAVYQWLDCDNGFSLINGETNQSYTAINNGNYAVKVTLNGCSSISDCIAVNGIGIIENSFGENFKVFPNPTSGNLSISLGNSYENISAKIYTLTGKEVGSYEFHKADEVGIVIDQAKGFYFIELVASGNKKAVIKILKN